MTTTSEACRRRVAMTSNSPASPRVSYFHVAATQSGSTRSCERSIHSLHVERFLGKRFQASREPEVTSEEITGGPVVLDMLDTASLAVCFPIPVLLLSPPSIPPFSVLLSLARHFFFSFVRTFLINVNFDANSVSRVLLLLEV